MESRKTPAGGTQACYSRQALLHWVMTEQEIYDGVIMSGTTDFAFVVDTLRLHGARWCVIGGLAVNTYAEPVYTADLDLVVIAGELEPVLADLRAADFRVKEFPFSVNAQRRGQRDGQPASKLMVQFTRPERYQDFVERAVLRTVLGLGVPVAALADVVRGKLWAWSDPTRRPAKKLKDKLDLIRLAENHPTEVEPLLPEELRAEAVANRMQGRPPEDEDNWAE